MGRRPGKLLDMGIYFELFGREFAWLNNWYSIELARAYYVWSTMAFLGVLQTAAAVYRRRTLALIPHRIAGMIVGLALWSGALVSFYVSQYRLIFVPGPATTEAVVVLGVAALTAIAITRVAAGLLQVVGGEQTRDELPA